MIHDTASYTQDNFRILTSSVSNYTMKRYHFHDDYEIYYLNSGSRDYFITDKTFHVDQGNLVLIKPHDLHKTIETGESHSRVLISFTDSFLPLNDMSRIVDICFSSSRVLCLNTYTKNAIEAMLQEMIHCTNKKRNFYTTKIQCTLANLLMETANYIEKTNKTKLHDQPANQRVYDIIQYLKQNYNKNITLEELSERFFISRYYITRIFKKATGFTIFEYLHSLRVIEAQKLLKETSMKIIEVSGTVGYSNVSNFGKVFKSITNMSPLQYRKTYQDSLKPIKYALNT